MSLRPPRRITFSLPVVLVSKWRLEQLHSSSDVQASPALTAEGEQTPGWPVGGATGGSVGAGTGGSVGGATGGSVGAGTGGSVGAGTGGSVGAATGGSVGGAFQEAHACG